MTGKERLKVTFEGKQADRMPISPFIYYNNIYEMFKYKPNINTYMSPDDFDMASKYVEYHDHFGWDVLFAVGLMQDSYIPPSAENWDVEIIKEGDDDHQRRTTIIKTPEGELSQVLNFDRSSKYLIVFAAENYAIETKKDFEIFRKYVPPQKTIDLDMMRRANEAVGDKGMVNICVLGAFNTLNQFRKLDTMMIDPVVDKGFYNEMIDFFADWSLTHILEAVEAGSESIEIGGNLAGSAVGPQFFKDHVLDYENRIIKRIREEGGYVVYHNCGDAQKIMHLYNDMDMHVWGYVTTQPFGDVNLDDALKTIRPDMALRGNIDQVEFLRKATPAEVDERVKELIDKVKYRGNWILCTSDFPFDGQPYENLHAFTEAGLKYGQY
jgi:uroporphyrinogen decarboxylase-like protein